MSNWQPIETAPKTPGPTPVLGYANGVQFIMIWRQNWDALQRATREQFGESIDVPRFDDGWYVWNAGRVYIEAGAQSPTHWMPLPAPPEGKPNPASGKPPP